MSEKKILDEKNWSEVVEFNCGCSAKIEKKNNITMWVIDNFCLDHDPTVYPNDTNDFE